MATLPPNTQRPQSFHPDFDCEVFMVVFSVRAIISPSWWSILNLSKGWGSGFQGRCNPVGHPFWVPPHNALRQQWPPWCWERRHSWQANNRWRLYCGHLCQLFRLVKPQVRLLSFCNQFLLNSICLWQAAHGHHTELNTPDSLWIFFMSHICMIYFQGSNLQPRSSSGLTSILPIVCTLQGNIHSLTG